MTAIELSRHASTPCAFVRRLRAGAHWDDHRILSLRYAIEGDLHRLRIPVPAQPLRTDGLWHHTCFEAFLQIPGDEAYQEINLSPSGQWAVYRFTAYRQGLSNPEPVPIPWIVLRSSAERFELTTRLKLGGVTATRDESRRRLGLSAVIEDIDGEISYWAVSHPAGQPDFHHPDSRALALAPSRCAAASAGVSQ